MTNKEVSQFFDKAPSGSYDERNKRLSAISDNLHFLSAMVLKELPDNARILCVGVGTGSEILGLAKYYPNWTFDGVDPAAGMLDDCKKRLEKEGLSSRCKLFQGYLSDFQSTEKYDAVLCILVMHFVQNLDERGKMFQDMSKRLKAGGILINAEIGYDMNAPKFKDIIEPWKQVQILMGATQASVDQLQTLMRERLLLLPPEQTQALIEKNGFSSAIQFFQSILIHGWYARKSA